MGKIEWLLLAPTRHTFDEAELWIAAKNSEEPFPNTQKRCQLNHERSRGS